MSSSASVAPSEGSRRSSRSSQMGRGVKSVLNDTKDSLDHANISGKIIELDNEIDSNDVDSTASMFKILQKTVCKLLNSMNWFTYDFACRLLILFHLCLFHVETIESAGYQGDQSGKGE